MIRTDDLGEEFTIKFVNFYRVPACYACRARYCFYQFRPSVRPVPVMCLNECICSHIFYALIRASSSFEPHRRYQIPMGSLLQRRHYIHGIRGWEDVRFSTEVAVYLGNETGPWLLRITNRKSSLADRSVSVQMTLSDLERRHAKGHISVGSP